LPFVELVRQVRADYRGRDDWLGDWRVPLPWSGEYVKCSDMSMLVAIALLKDMGKPWSSTQMSEMVHLGLNFGCARCPTVVKRMTWVQLVAHFVDRYQDQKVWTALVEQQAVQPIRRKPPYCVDFVNVHDVDDTSTRLVHLPRTFEVGTINPLGQQLDAAAERDSVAPSVFPSFETASCEICWRLDMSEQGVSYTPIELKRHIRQFHGKEPERRDAHRPRRS